MPDPRKDFALKLMADDPNISDADLQSALKAYDAHQTAKPQEPARNLGDTYKDLGVGIVKGAAHTALDLGELAGKLPVDLQGGTLGGAVDTLYGKPGLSAAAFPAARDATAYSNPAQQVGGAAETIAEMAIPVGEAANAIPNAARAGQRFQNVMAAAKSIPVDTNAAGQVGLRIQEIASRGGGTMPRPVSQFLNWITDPQKPPMDYEVARDFASGISKLSANEMGRLSPVVAREVAGLRVALNKAVADAAGKAGQGAEYAKAMTEYARSKQIENGIDAVVQGARRALPYALGAGAAGASGYWLTKHLTNLLGGD